MLCEICKKNEATIHIKKVLEDKSVVTTHLCAECARKQEESGPLGPLGFNLMESLFNIGKLAAKEAAAALKEPEEPGKEEHDDSGPVCPVCGWNTAKIRSGKGRMGCPECYRTFHDLIGSLLERIQRGTLHVGKQPGRLVNADSLALQFKLRIEQQELQRRIAREEYEEAALCRDRIAALKRELAAISPDEVEK